MVNTDVFMSQVSRKAFEHMQKSDKRNPLLEDKTRFVKVWGVKSGFFRV